MPQNQFTRYWDLGFKRLVPIIPPDAAVSEKSTLFKRLGTHQDGRGKTPGIMGYDKHWRGFDWLPYEADEADLKRWAAMGAGVGIKTGGGVIAIDADTLNPDYAQQICAIVDEVGGGAPIRVGNHPKALYVFRISEPIKYMRVEFGEPDARGNKERVEVLSDGRQFVAEGTHPKTKKPYSWPRDLVPFDELPELTPAQVVEILDKIRETLPQSSETIEEGAATDINQAALWGDLETIRKAVEATPNTSQHFPSRESYRDFGYAIKASLPDHEDEALEIYQDWCARWSEGENDPDVVAADWRRMKPPFRRGASWLYDIAERTSENFRQAEVWFENLDVKVRENPFAQIAVEQAETAKTTATFRVLSIDEIINRPPPEWLIEKYIPSNSFGFLYADPGAGKTFLALDMALYIASGAAAWHGNELKAPEQAGVLYLAAEGSFGFRNRIKAWLQANKEKGLRPKNFKMIETAVNFMNVDDLTKLHRTVAAELAGMGVKPALIVVDTVSRALPGADENLQKDMTRFVVGCDQLKEAWGCTVLGVHHNNKSGDMRGSSVLLGAGDFVLRLDRPVKSSIGKVTCDKQKDGPSGWEDTFLFNPIFIDAETSSLTVSKVQKMVGPEVKLTPSLTKNILEKMQADFDEGAPWSMVPQVKPERHAAKRMVADFGLAHEQALAALEGWEQAGIIATETTGKGGRKSGFKPLLIPTVPASVFD